MPTIYFRAIVKLYNSKNYKKVYKFYKIIEHEKIDI